MMTADPTPRRVYRFQNFEKAMSKFSAAINLSRTRKLSELEELGLFRNFKVSLELLWKVLLDYLIENKVALEEKTPRKVFLAAEASGLIRGARTWLKMLDVKNESSNLYIADKFNDVAIQIEERFSPLFQAFHSEFNRRLPT